MTKSQTQGSYLPPAGWLDDVKSTREGPGLLFLLAMTLVALVLRFYRLDGQSLWVDELLTWAMVRPGHGLHFWTQTLDSIQGPLFQVVIWPLLRWEDSGLMMRLPAAIAGAASIPIFGMVAGQLFGRQTARLATIFWVINPLHIWYSQEARGYSFLIFFILLAAFLFLKMKDEGPTAKKAIAFGLVSAAAVWSNMSALFLWAAMGLSWVLFTGNQDNKERMFWLIAFGLGLLSVAPWILKAMGIWAVDRIVPGADTGSQLRGETTFSILALPYTLFTFFFGYSWGPSLRDLHAPDRLGAIRPYLPLLAAGGIPLATGLVHGFFKAHGRRMMLLVWIIVPVAILVVLALRNIKPWNPRYVMIVLPWVLMVAAHGLSNLPRKPGLVLGILMGVTTLYSVGNHFFRPYYFKEDIRSAATWVQQNNDPADAMLVPVVTTVFNYYYGGSGEVINTFRRPKISDSVGAEKFVQEAIGNQDVLWVILAREWFFDPDDRVLVALSRTGNLHLEHEETGVRIFKWQRSQFGGGDRGNK